MYSTLAHSGGSGGGVAHNNATIRTLEACENLSTDFFVIDKSQDAFHGKNLVVIYTEFHQFPLISATRHGYRIFKIRASRIKPRGPDACWEIPGLTKETHWYTDLVL